MKSRFSLSTILLLCATIMVAQNIEKHKVITRAYPITKDTQIQIDNKYGNIQVVNWNKDSVKFEIDITVSGRKYEKVLKTFVYIDVDFAGNQYYASAKTIFKNDKSNFWSDVADLTNSILKGGNNAEINYTVYMPGTNALEIKNKFGNVYLSDRIAVSNIFISNGDLKANNFIGYLELDFSYGTVNIKEINKARIQAGYAEFSLNKINELTLDSKSSTINCNRINNLKINSRRDKLYLGELTSVSGEFSLSFMRIERLFDGLTLKTKFGDLEIREVSQDFNYINVYSGNTDISSTFERNTSFNLDLTYTRKTQISIPTSHKNLKEEYVSKDKEESRLTANFGANLQTKTEVKIIQSSGRVELIQK